MSQRSVFAPDKPARSGHGLLLILLGLIAGLLLAAANRQNIYDYVALHGYKAPDTISTIADEDTMTPSARKVFYVNHPQIVNKGGFGQYCNQGRSKEKTIVLGCYHSNQAGIYVLEIDDARLTGVEQVTAAHEMLHAAYDRLSSRERSQVDAMLQDYYNNHLTDDRIKQTIDAYKQSEPDDVVNEMHSIFGTEVASLPAPLEQYYSRYFSKRSAVTNFAGRYQAEFTSRSQAVKQYDQQLAALKAQIDATNADLKAKYVAITSEQSRLASLRNSGQISEYNAGVGPYNRQVDDYNIEVSNVQSLVDHYNEIVAQRNAIALQQQELANALSSTAEPIK